MSKRLSRDIKSKILNLAKNSLTFAQLERKVNTGYRTIKTNCEELESFGMLKIEEAINTKNGQVSNVVKITERGLEFLKKQHKSR